MDTIKKNIEIVKPVLEGGVEFYVSKDGFQRGISQSGCARLCGVKEPMIRQIISGLLDRSRKPNKSLEHLVGADLYLALGSSRQAKVLDSKVAASLIAYYAFERNNETARYSLSKFASIGIDQWIDRVTGAVNSNDGLALLNSINATMGKLLVKVENLERIEEETQGYRKAVVTLPLLEKWMSELSEGEKEKVLAPAEETYTIKEAIEAFHPGTIYSSTVLKKLALKVGQTIAALSDKPALKKQTPNGKGYNMSVNAYTKDQLPLVRLCLQSILSEF
jgi:hypothetical protein